MTHVVIAIPAWGPAYVDLALRYTVPAIMASLAAFDPGAKVSFIVHTDERTQFRAALPNYRIEFCPVVRGPGDAHESNWRAFERAHRDAIERAPMGSLLILLNADIVCSVETIATVHAALAGDKKVGMAVGIRTLLGTEPVPVGASADRLAEWTWQHRHPIIRELMWGTGRSDVPTMLFFAHPGGHVSMHCFHLAPMFILKDRDMQYSGTIDDDLVERNYQEFEIHRFTEREFMLAEISPAGKTHGASHPLSVTGVLEFARRFQLRPSHFRHFRHRFKIIGQPGENHEAADYIIAEIAVRGWER